MKYQSLLSWLSAETFSLHAKKIGSDISCRFSLSSEDNLHEISNPISGKKIRKIFQNVACRDGWMDRRTGLALYMPFLPFFKGRGHKIFQKAIC